MSSIKSITKESKMDKKILFIKLMKVVGTLVNLKDITKLVMSIPSPETYLWYILRPNFQLVIAHP